MTLQVEPVRRMRAIKETTFGTEASLGSFVDVPFVEGTGTFTLDIPTESPMHAQQHIDGIPTSVLMPRSATLNFDIPIETLDTKAADTVTAANGALGQLLEVIMGGKQLGTGTTVNDASPSTTLNTLAVVTNIVQGGAIGMPTGTGSAMEVRTVKTKSGSDITPKHAFTNAPSNGGSVLAAATYYLGALAGDTALSGQFAVEGLYTGDRFLLLGGQIASPPTFNTANGARPILSTQWKFATFKYDSETSTDLSGTLAAATYTNVVPLVIKDSEFRTQVVGTGTIGTLLHARNISFKPNLAYGPHSTPAGIETVKQWIRLRTAPVITVEFDLPFEDMTWYTARDAKTKHDFTLQIGSSMTYGAVMLEASSCQVVNVQRINEDGISGIHVTAIGGIDTDAGSSSAIQQSAFRVHIL